MTKALQQQESEARKWDKWYREQVTKYMSECGECTSRKMTDDEVRKYCNK